MLMLPVEMLFRKRGCFRDRIGADLVLLQLEQGDFIWLEGLPEEGEAGDFLVFDGQEVQVVGKQDVFENLRPVDEAARALIRAISATVEIS